MAETDVLPQQATTVEFNTEFIDWQGRDGYADGPAACQWTILQSLPPQCFGPIIDGYDISTWAEEESAVFFGERSVVVGWPPVDGHVGLISETAGEWLAFDLPHEALPEECADLDISVPTTTLQGYDRSLGAASGGLVVSKDAVLYLQVTGDPEPHRDAMAADGHVACIVPVERSEDELQRIADELNRDIAGQGLWEQLFVNAANRAPGGRVDVKVAVADLATIEAVASLVDDRTSIRIVGFAVLLADDDS